MSPILSGSPSTRRFGYAIASVLAVAPAIACADFEEVRILRTEPVQYQICPPPGQAAQAPQPMQAAQPAPPGAPQIQQAQGAPYPQQPPQAQQAPQPAAAGIGGREILGGVAGAAVGGLLGNQVGSGSGKTVATVAGAGVGAYAGYKLAEQKPQAAPPPPQAMQAAPPVCTLATYYRVHYARINGLQGNVTMSSQPTGAALMINFCGERPCN